MTRITEWTVMGKVSKDFFEIRDMDALGALTGDADSMLVRSHDDPFRLMVLMSPSNEKGILLFNATIDDGSDPVLELDDEAESSVIGFPVTGTQIIEIWDNSEDPNASTFSAELSVGEIKFIAFGVWTEQVEIKSLETVRKLGDKYRLFFQLDELHPGLDTLPSGQLHLLDFPLPDIEYVENRDGG